MRESVFGVRLTMVVLVLTMSPTLAMAYIDPGNGAYMVQALFTVVAAGIFYLRHPVQTLKGIGRWISERRKFLGKPKVPQAATYLDEPKSEET